MSANLSQRGFRTLPSVLVALAAVAGAAPSRAQAGCAHYVVSKNAPAESLNHVDVLDQGPAPHGVSLNGQLPPHPRRCSGALCSGKPAAPVPAPVLAGGLRGEQWGNLMTPPFLEPGPDRARAQNERIVYPLVEGPSIERPPRV